MKVLHLINNLKREGAQVVVYNLATTPGSGHILHVVCAREPGGQLQSSLENNGVPVYVPDQYYGALHTSRSMRFISEVIDSESIDIIHAHMADAGFLGWLVARKRGMPLIITHHGHDILPVCNFLCRAVYFICLFLSARYARRNVVVSASVAERVLGKLALKTDRVSVITNGVPIPEEEKFSKRNRLESRELNIVSVGRLVELKGHDQLISAAKIIVKEHQDVRFYIVGGGPLGDSLQQQVHSLGLSSNFVFTGSVDDVSIYLREADIYVSTSHSEGMPVATLEAMSWNVPVIASDIPGNRSIVEPDETGLLYELGDVNALVSSIRQVAGEPELARERARRAYLLVKDHFSAESTIRAYGRLYNDVLGVEQQQGNTYNV